MYYPLNKIPIPKYIDKALKRNKTKKTVLVSHIDTLFNDSYLKNYFAEHKKTHSKKDTPNPEKIDSKKTKRKVNTQ